MKRHAPGATIARIIALAALAAVLSPAPLWPPSAAITVTSFDRIRVEGPYDVTVVSGRGAGGAGHRQRRRRSMR